MADSSEKKEVVETPIDEKAVEPQTTEAPAESAEAPAEERAPAPAKQVTLNASSKRSRDDDDEDDDNDDADGSESANKVQVRDSNGEIIKTDNGNDDDDNDDTSSSKQPAKRRKSEQDKTEKQDNDDDETTDPAAAKDKSRESTAELEAALAKEASEGATTLTSQKLDSMPSELPDSDEDEKADDKKEDEEKEEKKEETKTTESADTPTTSAPASAASFVSASTTFTGGFGSFVKSGFSAASTPKTNIFGGSGSGSGGDGDKTTGSAASSGFKSGFSGFGSSSAFLAPKKDNNPWAEKPSTESGTGSGSGSGTTSALPSGTGPKSMFGSGSNSGSSSTAITAKDDAGSADDADEGNTSAGTTGTGDDLYVQLATPLAERKVETGEESEESKFSCRTKLYVLDLTDSSAGWKERGVGTLHVNSQKATSTSTDSTSEENETTTPKAKSRLVMRVDGSLRVALNLPWQKDSFKVMQGMKSSLQSEKFVRVSVVEDGNRPVQYAMKVGNAKTATSLYEAIAALP